MIPGLDIKDPLKIPKNLYSVKINQDAATFTITARKAAKNLQRTPRRHANYATFSFGTTKQQKLAWCYDGKALEDIPQLPLKSLPQDSRVLHGGVKFALFFDPRDEVADLPGKQKWNFIFMKNLIVPDRAKVWATLPQELLDKLDRKNTYMFEYTSSDYSCVFKTPAEIEESRLFAVRKLSTGRFLNPDNWIKFGITISDPFTETLEGKPTLGNFITKAREESEYKFSSLFFVFDNWKTGMNFSSRLYERTKLELDTLPQYWYYQHALAMIFKKKEDHSSLFIDSCLNDDQLEELLKIKGLIEKQIELYDNYREEVLTTREPQFASHAVKDHGAHEESLYPYFVDSTLSAREFLKEISESKTWITKIRKLINDVKREEERIKIFRGEINC